MKVSISAVVITLNEEHNIERCILSARKVADEVLVVDSFSTDRTLEICNKLAVKIVQHPFKGYASQKNVAMQLASNDYVLNLDADEMLSDELEQSIFRVKDNWDSDGYCFNRLNNLCGRWIRRAGWYPDRKLRLVDRRKAHWGGGEVHEKIIMEKNTTVKFLNGDLLHYTNSTIADFTQQQMRFADLWADEAFRTGTRSTAWRMVLNPAYTFLKKLFIQLGILEGKYGWIISVTAARANFRKYKRLRELSA